MRRLTLLIMLGLLISAGDVRGAEPTDRFLDIARPLVEALNQRDYKAARKDFTKAMSEAFPPTRADPFFETLLDSHGKIKKLGRARYLPPNQAVIPLYFERGIMDMKIVLRDDNKIIGFWVLQHTAEIPVPERNETVMSLPFKGRWVLTWGGDTKELNYHHDVPNQRFAFDLLGVGEDGKTRKGDAAGNEDYYAFGREVLAPAAGVVTDVITGVRDNVPGSMNSSSAVGNAVFIQHAEREISVLAHFKLGSIRVKAGQKVDRGQVLCLCGNSGNSSEPHIHYHLMNTPIIQEATSIKVRFEDVMLERDGKKKRMKDYSPIKGDIISPPASSD